MITSQMVSLYEQMMDTEDILKIENGLQIISCEDILANGNAYGITKRLYYTVRLLLELAKYSMLISSRLYI